MFYLQAYCIHGITNDDVKDKAPFPEVFETFCKWVTKQTELTGADGIDYYPGNDMQSHDVHH